MPVTHSSVPTTSILSTPSVRSAEVGNGERVTELLDTMLEYEFFRSIWHGIAMWSSPGCHNCGTGLKIGKRDTYTYEKLQFGVEAQEFRRAHARSHRGLRQLGQFAAKLQWIG
ncbi:hypothetical protein DFP72DRAFT_849267 [Ephemerocybe angulata]|uniref:Uncharacterized protein n=1 Tax=Ephemerocybe angulata TaxID=980116 RepID=A0A8H6HWR6_9AGAR|nr:hypothetical protein DFP72DRAFT_849267 [Tulosesus angulatus]